MKCHRTCQTSLPLKQCYKLLTKNHISSGGSQNNILTRTLNNLCIKRYKYPIIELMDIMIDVFVIREFKIILYLINYNIK